MRQDRLRSFDRLNGPRDQESAGRQASHRQSRSSRDPAIGLGKKRQHVQPSRNTDDRNLIHDRHKAVEVFDRQPRPQPPLAPANFPLILSARQHIVSLFRIVHRQHQSASQSLLRGCPVTSARRSARPKQLSEDLDAPVDETDAWISIE